MDKRLYKECKKLSDHIVRNRPWCFTGDVVDWTSGFFPLIKEMAAKENYEAAQAMKDSITELYSELTGEKLPKDVQLKLDRVTHD